MEDRMKYRIDSDDTYTASLALLGEPDGNAAKLTLWKGDELVTEMTLPNYEHDEDEFEERLKKLVGDPYADVEKQDTYTVQYDLTGTVCFSFNAFEDEAEDMASDLLDTDFKLLILEKLAKDLFDIEVGFVEPGEYGTFVDDETVACYLKE